MNTEIRILFFGIAATLFVVLLRKVFSRMNTKTQLEHWRLLYEKLFSITLGDVVLPHGKSKGLIVAGLTLKQVMTSVGKYISVECIYKDLGTEVFEDERLPGTIYAVLMGEQIRDSPDEIENNSSTLTLIEGLLYFLSHHIRTGRFPDGVLLCSGSRDSRGRVPILYWQNNKLYVVSIASNVSDPGMYARKVLA